VFIGIQIYIKAWEAFSGDIVKSKRIDFMKMLELYRSEPFTSIVLFWLRYAADWKNGGFVHVFLIKVMF
jgi:hypothetical protein